VRSFRLDADAGQSLLHNADRRDCSELPNTGESIMIAIRFQENRIFRLHATTGHDEKFQ